MLTGDLQKLQCGCRSSGLDTANIASSRTSRATVTLVSLSHKRVLKVQLLGPRGSLVVAKAPRAWCHCVLFVFSLLWPFCGSFPLLSGQFTCSTWFKWCFSGITWFKRINDSIELSENSLKQEWLGLLMRGIEKIGIRLISTMTRLASNSELCFPLPPWDGIKDKEPYSRFHLHTDFVY